MARTSTICTTEAPLSTPAKRRLIRRAVFLTDEEDRILAENAHRRYLPSKAEYLRMLIDKDAQGELLVIDDAVMNIARGVGEAFGGFFGQLQAEVERASLGTLADTPPAVRYRTRGS